MILKKIIPCLLTHSTLRVPLTQNVQVLLLAKVPKLKPKVLKKIKAKAKVSRAKVPKPKVSRAKVPKVKPKVPKQKVKPKVPKPKVKQKVPYRSQTRLFGKVPYR